MRFDDLVKFQTLDDLTALAEAAGAYQAEVSADQAETHKDENDAWPLYLPT